MITNSPQRATIIGSSGFVGGHLKHRLKSRGADVWTPNRNEIKDLTGQNLGCLYYCAGKTSNFLEDPQQTIEAHITLICDLLRQANYSKVIYLSSTRLNDSNKRHGHFSKAIKEDEYLPINPLNKRHFYDITKAAGENICLSLGKDKACVARLSCVWDTSKSTTSYIGKIGREINKTLEAQGEKSLTLSTSYDTARHYVHINDAVTALEILGDTDQPHKIISFASDQKPTTNRRIFKIIESTFGVKIKIRQSPSIQSHSSDNPHHEEKYPLFCPKLDISNFNQLFDTNDERIKKPRPFIEDLITQIRSINDAI